MEQNNSTMTTDTTSSMDHLKEGAIILASVFTCILACIGILYVIKYFYCRSAVTTTTTSSSGVTNQYHVRQQLERQRHHIYNTTRNLSSSNMNNNIEQSLPTTTIVSSSSSPKMFPYKIRRNYLESKLQHEIFHIQPDIEKGIVPPPLTSSSLTTVNEDCSHNNIRIPMNQDDDSNDVNPVSTILSIQLPESSSSSQQCSTTMTSSSDLDSIVTPPPPPPLPPSTIATTAVKKQRESTFIECTIDQEIIHRTNSTYSFNDTTNIQQQSMDDDCDTNHTDMSCSTNSIPCCDICYETLQDHDEISISNCQKIFHRSCIIEWLMTHNTCPYCRNTFQNI